MGRRGRIVPAVAIPRDLAANRTGMTAEATSNRRFFGPFAPHLTYGFALFYGKVMCHRWASVRVGVVNAHIRTTQRWFQQ